MAGDREMRIVGLILEDRVHTHFLMILLSSHFSDVAKQRFQAWSELK
jgi:hypothetical protein